MNQDLIGSEFRNEKVFWDGGNDTKEEYRRNIRKYGKTWEWKDVNIKYKYNSNGFRAPEFNTVDWANSIVILGCSNVLGVGNLLENSVPSVVERLINIPTVNLGISGSAVDHACWNSLILHENYPHPKAIVQVWSSTQRYTDFLDVGMVRHDYPIFGVPMCPSNVQPRKSHYCAKHTWELRSKFYAFADRALWKNKTLYYEASFFKHSAEQLEVPFVAEVDQARDYDHPGPKTCRLMAELIVENLKEQGIK